MAISMYMCHSLLEMTHKSPNRRHRPDLITFNMQSYMIYE